MRKSFILFAIAVLGFAGCQKQEFEEASVSKGVFTACVEDFDASTKTSMSPDRSVLWSSGDRVAVFQGNTLADEYVISSNSVGKGTATLEYVGNNGSGTGGFNAGMELPCNVAFYPYSRILKLTGATLDSDGDFYITDLELPDVQKYEGNSFSNGAFPMVAVTPTKSDKKFHFKNVMGVLKLQLTGTQSVQSIEIRGNSGEGLSGSATVALFSENKNPEISVSPKTSVTLYCEDAVQLNPHSATPFMIALPPTSFVNGFTVLVTDMEEKIYEISTDKQNTVLRSSILVMPPVSLEDIEPGYDEHYGKEEAGYLNALTDIYNDITDMYWGHSSSDGSLMEFVRAYWTLQELPADAVKGSWGDAYMVSLNSADLSDATYLDPVCGVYSHSLKIIEMVNEFLRKTEEEKLDHRGCSQAVKAKVVEYRAEARFLRAYFYWVLMDLFGNVPFSTEHSPIGVNYPQKSSEFIFNFLIDEIDELIADSDLPAPRSNYPRADIGSLWGLAARVSLNAETYTGGSCWELAKTACEAIFAQGYILAPTHAELFRGDNGENPDAKREFLFAIPYDSQHVQSYGGTTFLTMATSQEMEGPQMLGISSSWAGIRTPYEYVRRWFPDVKDPDYVTGDFTFTDKRAEYFYIKGRSESMQYNINSFLSGWSFFKFNNTPHEVSPESYESQAYMNNFASIDFPVIRLGEIYLIYAEACYRLGLQQEALTKLSELAARSGVEAPTEITEEYLLAERSRELMWEGHRRTDLIRFGKWIRGYDWTYKGGIYSGQDLPSHYDLYPIPQIELDKNPNLMQNPGY